MTAMETATTNLEFTEFELSLKEYAKANNVPIIIDEGLSFLETIIKLHKPKRILEIGTAIGYSAIRMNKACGSEIYTIERNSDMYENAKANINKLGLDDQIHIIFKDALEAFDLVSHLEFDLIFIDAAKAQYMKFFDIYTPLLSKCGVVVCDNMLFHGLVSDEENYQSQSRSVRGLIRKLKSFHEALLNNKDYDTSIFTIGDGMAVSIKKD
ncbi:MAG: O-methyltransferase [Acholeplasmatales bacterium]|nr:O-methyltransferase [Acholeplasmatales bacterium]